MNGLRLRHLKQDLTNRFGMTTMTPWPDSTS